jgi:hypothetical protein
MVARGDLSSRIGAQGPKRTDVNGPAPVRSCRECIERARWQMARHRDMELRSACRAGRKRISDAFTVLSGRLT